MNVEFILNLINPYLQNNKLSEYDFKKIFKVLNLHEQYLVIDTLIANNIEIDYNMDAIIDVKLGKKIESKKIYREKEVKVHKPIINNTNLSNEALCLLYQKGDKRALDLLYIKNNRFIWKMVMNIGKRYNHKLEDEDLVAYGFFGLKKAVEKFNCQLENKFLTYAGHWINQSILRAIADYGFTIRIPVHMFENINYIKRVSRDNNFDSKIEFINYICNDKAVNEDKVLEWFSIAEYVLAPISLNISVGEDGDTEFIEFISNHEEPVEKQCEKNILKEDILKCVDRLKPRESEIIKMRFGFDCNQMTLEEVGKNFKLTRERIRQIEAKAMTRLKYMKKIKELKIYLED